MADISVRIGIDLMGGDTPPEDLFQGVIQLINEKFDAEMIVIATSDVLQDIDSPVEVMRAKDVIEMDDDPLLAVRRKKESSMAIGLQLLKEKRIDAFISVGNTGALLLTVKRHLPKLPGIDRPALLAILPTLGKEIAVLDVGANLSLKPKHLYQLASMGIAYQTSRGVKNPTVGLLNIGSESKKGTAYHQEVYQALEALNRDTPTFIGNIEGKQAFRGDIDVLVTDGFTGNIFLKTAEGCAAFILDEIEQKSLTNTTPEIKSMLLKLKTRLHWTEYPGAILAGIDGVVVKCHGDSSPIALMNGIKGAYRLVKHDFLNQIKKQLLL